MGEREGGRGGGRRAADAQEERQRVARPRLARIKREREREGTHKAAHHADRHLEDLDARVDVERDVLDDLADGLLERRLVAEHGERVERVDDGEEVVAHDVVDAGVGAVEAVVALTRAGQGEELVGGKGVLLVRVVGMAPGALGELSELVLALGRVPTRRRGGRGSSGGGEEDEGEGEGHEGRESEARADGAMHAPALARARTQVRRPSRDEGEGRAGGPTTGVPRRFRQGSLALRPAPCALHLAL